MHATQILNSPLLWLASSENQSTVGKTDIAGHTSCWSDWRLTWLLKFSSSFFGILWFETLSRASSTMTCITPKPLVWCLLHARCHFKSSFVRILTGVLHQRDPDDVLDQMWNNRPLLPVQDKIGTLTDENRKKRIRRDVFWHPVLLWKWRQKTKGNRERPFLESQLGCDKVEKFSD